MTASSKGMAVPFSWKLVGVKAAGAVLRDAGATRPPQVVAIAYGDPELLEGALDGIGDGSHPAGAFQFDGVALPVLESDGLDVFAPVGLNRLNQAGGGILTAGEDDQGLLVLHGES